MIKPTLNTKATSLAIMIAFLSACSSTPPNKPTSKNKSPLATSPLKNKSRFQTATLADIEERDIKVQKGALAPQSAEDTLANYQSALSLFHNPTERLDAMKRIADFTMQSSQDKDLGSDKNSAKQSGTPTAKLSEDELYEQFMQGTANAKNRQSIAKAKAKREARPVDISYGQAIKSYQDLLKTPQSSQEKSDTYYQLAKAYDMNGQREESIGTLRELIKKVPDSEYIVESKFRIAEHEFTVGKYLVAADLYNEVVKSPNNADFRQQALYKQGWALYKGADYPTSQVVFFQILDELLPKPKINIDELKAKASTYSTSIQSIGKIDINDLRKRRTDVGGLQRDGKYINYKELIADAEKQNAASDASLTPVRKQAINDTYEILSLCFMQQDGVKTVNAHFQKVGAKDYESEVYMRLGQMYVSKRLFRNAAETFDNFVTKHPFDKRSPEFSTATIKTYQDGGFPSEVIPAKENFVRRYNMKSEYWARSDQSTRLTLLPLLQSHVIDLAKFWHAKAQQSQLEADYMKAAGWYREHLTLAPAENEAITINQLLSEALFAAKHFPEAIIEFEKTAYKYKNNPKAQEAAYFALLAYHEEEKAGLKGTPEEQTAWWGRRAASTHKYAANFPGDKNTASLLQGLTNDQIARKDLAGAMKTANILINLNPPAPTDVQMEAWMVVADGELDLGNLEKAETAYNRVLTFTNMTPEKRRTYQERLTISVYKQAEKFRDAKNVDGAVAAFLRAASVTPDPAFKAASEFDAATVLLNAERYAGAIPMLEAFRKNYPGNKLNETIPVKLALSYEKTGQLDRAANEYENISNLNLGTNPQLAQEALWTAAEMYDKAKRTDEGVRVYKSYITRFPKPLDTQMEATFRIYTFYDKQTNVFEANTWLKEIARNYDRAGAENTARMSYLGAMAKFKLNQPLYDEFAAIPLKQPLKQSLGKKKAAMQKALEAYNKVSAIGVAEFVSASNYQVAEIYRKLAADLMVSERPAGLNELELEQYGILLEEQASPFEDKALDLYKANADLAKQEIYDDSVKKSFAALAKLSPGRYNKKEQMESSIDSIY
jgi:TolA-binding protein